MQLHGGAGGLRSDGLRRARQALHPVDVEREVLTAGRHDLVVEEGVAVDIGKVGGDQVVTVERRQNADHHDPGIDLVRLPVSICQGRAELFRKPVEYAATEAMRGDVYFQIEHGEFCLEISTRDPFQYLPIHHFRHAVRPDKIQLDLQSQQILRAIEPLLGQQSLQPRQTLPELAAVVPAIGQLKLPRHDLLPHRKRPSSNGQAEDRPLMSRVTGDDAHPTRSITSHAFPSPATLLDVTGAHSSGMTRNNGPVRVPPTVSRNPELVRNADDNWPTSPGAYTEVIAARQPGKREKHHANADRRHPCSSHGKQLAETR